MDNIVESLSAAYDAFVLAAAKVVMEAKDQSDGQRTPSTGVALEAFKQQWEMFRVACDEAEAFVESMKQRIGSECLVDEATGAACSQPGHPAAAPGIPLISAVRLEQMSKAVRWQVIELQHGSGAAAASASASASNHSHASAPFDARFPEDAG
ncbi:hypothetical protein BHM03_00035458 [Ensete ventricosum]|uniref:Mediator of RNA polymerase II transcription subunit 32 n=1 Tax=Ensete ventricosum TaxID=4639 RepID=A0A445MJ97_ENSVE|nr:hypothetical protein BHM03_00035458 [Ensete ventricosum]